jgi:hypothetical protein
VYLGQPKFTIDGIVSEMSFIHEEEQCKNDLMSNRKRFILMEKGPYGPLNEMYWKAGYLFSKQAAGSCQ